MAGITSEKSSASILTQRGNGVLSRPVLQRTKTNLHEELGYLSALLKNKDKSTDHFSAHSRDDSDAEYDTDLDIEGKILLS